jgi:hypothetical protein
MKTACATKATEYFVIMRLVFLAEQSFTTIVVNCFNLLNTQC